MDIRAKTIEKLMELQIFEYRRYRQQLKELQEIFSKMEPADHEVPEPFYFVLHLNREEKQRIDTIFEAET